MDLTNHVCLRKGVLPLRIIFLDKIKSSLIPPKSFLLCVCDLKFFLNSLYCLIETSQNWLKSLKTSLNILLHG